MIIFFSYDFLLLKNVNYFSFENEIHLYKKNKVNNNNSKLTFLIDNKMLRIINSYIINFCEIDAKKKKKVL